MTHFALAHAINQGSVRLHRHGSIPFITFAAFEAHLRVSALMTLRNEEWDPAARGPDLLAAAGPFLSHVLAIPLQNFVAGQQVHGTRIFRLRKNLPYEPQHNLSRSVPSTDGLVTNSRRIALVVVTADCLPVFIYDRIQAAIALIHCGRQGTFDDILGVGIETMRQDFKTDPSHCIAVIGPSVGPCCYEIDLWGANEHRLKELGVSNVFNCRVCTKCNNDRFYSYRAERDHAGRMISAIALK
jgi:copper oxidase (laccase) domain-containing protein